ncbi:MAG: RNase adapter RapZ [Oscillospiraceae bacterium]|nr:RNase adapter RapZ [Oscillospiraceae bacterium]
MQLVIVTGMSGAGKSRAIDTLEDIGFFCVDNMTPMLIPTFVKILSDSAEVREKVAIVADIRLGDSFSQLFKALDELRIMECEYKILFIDADNEVLLRRYQETRRKHPLSSNDSSVELIDIIQKEREILKKARDIADYVIDTSLINTSQLKERIAKLFLDDVSNTLKVNVISFGFKYGIPKDSDLVFDVRCLPNPFYVQELKNHTGLESCVSDYIMQFEQSRGLVPKLLDLINYLVPLYRSEGKSQLTVSVGCTGGKHRSVTFAEIVYNNIKQQGYNVSVYHRDIKR